MEQEQNCLLEICPVFWANPDIIRYPKNRYFLGTRMVRDGVLMSVINAEETFTAEEIGHFLGGN